MRIPRRHQSKSLLSQSSGRSERVGSVFASVDVASDSGVLRMRGRVRKTVLAVAAVILVGAAVAWSWPIAVCAVIVGLAEPAVWKACLDSLPEPSRSLIRQSFRDAKASEDVSYLNPQVARHVAAETRPAGAPDRRAHALAAKFHAGFEIMWDGQSCVTVTDVRGGRWAKHRADGGVLAPWRAETVAKAGVRPLPPSELDHSLVEIGVILDRYFAREIVFLDRHSRMLASIPAWGFGERGVAELARLAGVAFSAYRLPTSGEIEGWTESLFPRSLVLRRFPESGTRLAVIAQWWEEERLPRRSSVW